jgi:hypothetical protein
MTQVEMQPPRFLGHVARDRRASELTLFEAPLGRRHVRQVVGEHVARERTRDALLVATLGEAHALDARVILGRQRALEVCQVRGLAQRGLTRQPEFHLSGSESHQPRKAASSSRLSSVSL